MVIGNSNFRGGATDLLGGLISRFCFGFLHKVYGVFGLGILLVPAVVLCLAGLWLSMYLSLFYAYPVFLHPFASRHGHSSSHSVRIT